MAENLNLKTIDTVDTRPFKKLVMTIGELPTSFVESMTYYELLAWFVNYLETVIIPTVNNNAEAVEELQQLFIKLKGDTEDEINRFEEYIIDLYDELKDFVDNYFENLDVQEEINNKLDQMVADGVLQEIIASYLNSRAFFGYDTVNDMKNATNFVDGSYAETLGYFSKNDGGNATYKIRKKTNADVIDEKFIIEITGDPNNELIAELIHDKEINVLQMGITEDNFSTVVNMLLTNNYNVYVPKGNYVAKETIVFNQHDSQFICDGKITLNTTKTMFRVLSYRNILKLNGSCWGDDQDDSILMEISGTETSNNNNIYIHDAVNFGVGIKMCPTGGKGCAYNTINWDIIRNFRVYGILITTGEGINFVNENWFIGGRLAGKTGALSGIKTIKGENQTDQFNGNVFDHVCIDEHYNIGVDLDFAIFNLFNDFRLSEGLDGQYYIKCSNTARENTFTTKSRMATTHILDESNDASYRNHYNIALRNTGGHNICDKFDIMLGGNIITSRYNAFRTQESVVTYTYNQTTNPSLPQFYVDGVTTVSLGFDSNQGDVTVTLPTVFRQYCISSFFIKITYLGNNTNLTINDGGNNNIITPSMLTTPINNKIFKVEYVAGNSWKITPYA